MKIGTTLISSVEFHGNMSLVIFLAGCPLRCPYCHNGEILEDGDDIDIGEVYKVIDDSKDFIDAVDVSGGEPLSQLDDLISILRVAKKLGLKTKLDTSGVYPDRLKKVLDLNLVDYVAMDIKSPFSKYETIIGSNIGENVKKSMELVNQYDKTYLECRTTYVPGLLKPEDIIDISYEINCNVYTLQQFRNRSVLDEDLKDIESPNPHELKDMAKKIKSILKDSVIKVKSAEFGEEVI
ncbi:MAG: anaerobic ribonucleoside-triphosphate reductase activating protein [Methanobacteriaceae archaeon]|nr:anaerobic ribonucleoside-triphosphate reductase activating protein [Methanobacteriaceae archaeon]MDD3408245.1 anaerobic ribonucleoside-triphosphate reductase activating protein [Methanobacteriaceae archaeon]